jgi:hypothetical protein
MYGKPFNPRRPFGEVKGDERFHFDQDGQLYNALKEPVDGDGKLMAIEAGAAPVVDAPAPVAVVAPENPNDDIPADELPFNILAWAQGDPALAKTPWEKVKAETARLVDDMTGVTGKEAARKAILAHYGL